MNGQEMSRKLIYVCSPLSAPTRPQMLVNALRASEYMGSAESEFGSQAVAPHAYLPYLLDDSVPEQRALALEFGQKLLALCSLLVVYGAEITAGMASEIALAQELGIPIEYRPDYKGNCLKKGAYYDQQKKVTFSWREYEDLPLRIYDDLLSVEWYNANEGYYGDYNPDDPNDENLLRFAVSIFNGESWEEVDDASYCTRIRANADDEQLARTLYYIFRQYRNVIDEYPVEHSVKKLGESLSWISL
jgi:hypothetical protein